MHWHNKEPAPHELIRFILYDRFGWTPAEVKAIGLPDILAILTIMHEQAKYQNRPKPKELKIASSA